MASTVVLANIEENNKKYLLLKKIASVFLLFISITMILLFLYFSTRNSYILYIVLFFIFFIDIETSYSVTNNEKEDEVVGIKIDEVEEDKNLVYKKLLKQMKKMKKEIRNSKIEIENLKKIKQSTEDTSFQVSSASSVVQENIVIENEVIDNEVIENDVIQYKSTSDLEKLIAESMKQFASDLIVVVNDKSML